MASIAFDLLQTGRFSPPNQNDSVVTATRPVNTKRPRSMDEIACNCLEPISASAENSGKTVSAAPVRTKALIGFVERIDVLDQSVVVIYMARFLVGRALFSEYRHIASRRLSDGPDRRDEQARPVYGLHKEAPSPKFTQPPSLIWR